MSWKYEPKSGVGLVEMAGPGGTLIVIKEGSSYESETRLLDFPRSALKESEVKEKASATKSETTEGGSS